MGLAWGSELRAKHPVESGSDFSLAEIEEGISLPFLEDLPTRSEQVRNRPIRPGAKRA